MKPLAIDLFCGLGGWTEGLLAEGYDVIGFDIEAHEYDEHRYIVTFAVLAFVLSGCCTVNPRNCTPIWYTQHDGETE